MVEDPKNKNEIGPQYFLGAMTSEMNCSQMNYTQPQQIDRYPQNILFSSYNSLFGACSYIWSVKSALRRKVVCGE